MRASRGLPSFRTEVVRNLFRQVLRRQGKRTYAAEFQVVHFSIQKDHLHLIVEAAAKTANGAAAKEPRKEAAAKEAKEAAAKTANGAAAKEPRKGAAAKEAKGAAAKEPRKGAAAKGAAAKAPTIDADREALRRGVSGLAISFARRLNRLLRRKGKVWSDRHHRRALESPTDVRNTLLYVLQNHRRHGVKPLGPGDLDPYSTAVRFRHWADFPATLHETEPWPDPTPRTWLLGSGWLRGGGPLSIAELPRAARASVRV